MKIADSAFSKTTISGNTYVDVIVNFDNLYTLLQDTSSTDGDAQVVASPYPNFTENTPIRFALTSSTNLNNVNKDISGSPANSLPESWSSYLSSNTSSLSNLVAGAPSITAIAESSSGGINATEAVDGTVVAVSLAGTNAVAGNTLTITWGNQTVNYTLTATDISNNSATVTVPAATLTAQGNGTFNVTAKIGSGVASPAVSVTVDTTAPAAPTISSIPETTSGLNASEAINGTIVSVGLSGTGAVAGDRLTINWGSQTVDYTLTNADIARGTAAVTVAASTLTTQGNGSFNVTAKLSDQAGNSSANSAAFPVIVDLSAPTAPTIGSIPEAVSGINSAEATDGTTVSVNLTGTGAIAGDKLTLNWGAQSLDYTLSTSDITNNTAVVTVPASAIATQGNGTFNVIAKLTDQAGNASPNSTPVSVTVDTTTPTAPTISSIPEATGGLNLAEAADGKVVNVSLTGTGAIAGDTLTLRWGSQTVNYSVTSIDISNGTAAVTVPASTITVQGNGTVSVTASLIDQAGNASANSNSVAVLVDILAPTAPTISSIPEAAGGIDAAEAADGTPVAVNLSGTGAVAGDILTVNWGSQTFSTILTTSEVTSGSATVTVSAATIAAQGVGTFNVTAQLSDAAGNSSVLSPAIAVTVNSAPASAPALSISEAAGGLNAAEAIDGTPVIVTLTGTRAVAGDSLTINWGSQAISYTLTASDIANSSATVTIPPVLITAAGEGTVNVLAQVGSGPLSSPIAVTVDRTGPSAPAIASIPESTAELNAAEAADGTIVTVNLAGTGAAAGDQLTLNWGTQTITYTLTSTDIANTSAAIVVSNSIIAAQGDGSFNTTATLTDQTGNSSASSLPVSVTVDTTIPGAPAISSVPEASGGINALEAADGTTVDVNLTGTGAAVGDTLTLSWGTQAINYTLTALDLSNSSASILVPASTLSDQGDGTFNLTAQLTDAAGNASSISAPFSVSVDTVTPTAPAISSIAEASGGLNTTEAADGTLVVVDLTGTGAAAGDTLRLSWGSQPVDYLLTASDIAADRATVLVSAATLAAQGNGTFNITAQLTDQSGNTSPTSTPFPVTVDIAAPAAPVLSSLPETTGGLNASEAADGTIVTVNLSGTAAVAGDTLTLNWGNQSVDYTLTNTDITTGNASVTVPAATIAAEGDGSVSVTAKLTDQAGNSSVNSAPVSVIVDTGTAAAPAIASLPEATGGLNRTEASDGTSVTVNLAATGAAAGDTLTLNWGNQAVTYSLTAADISNGSATVTVSAATIAAQGDGTFDVTASLTDPAGNQSPSSSPVSITVDTVASSAPTIAGIAEAAGGINAIEATDGTTVTVSLTGTGAVAGDTLTLNWGSQPINYTLTSSDISSGSVTIAVPAATIAAQGDGSFDVTATLTDQAGNLSNASSPVSVAVQTTAPAAPTIGAIPEAIGGLNGAEASDGTIVSVSLTGTGAAAGDTLTLSWGNQTVDYLLSNTDITTGTAIVTVTAATIAAQGDGPVNVTATLTNQAGNPSPSSTAVPVIVDTIAPSAASISLPEATGGINAIEAADGTTVEVNLTGTGATAGDTLTVTWGGQAVNYILTTADITSNTATVAVDAATLSAQGDGTFDVTAQLTDAAGNSGPPSIAVSVTANTAPANAPSLSLPEAANGLNQAEAADGTDLVVTLTGTGAVAGDSLSITWGSQTLNYTLTANDISSGSATVPIPAAAIAAQGEGAFGVTAQIGTGPVSSTLTVTVDTVAPAAPTITSIPEATGGLNGSEAADGTVVAVSLTGTGAVAGDTLTVTWGTATVDYTLTAADITNTNAVVTVPASVLTAQGGGNFNVTATLTDQAGNRSPASSPVAVTVDTTAPAAPAISDIPEAVAGLSNAEATDGVEVIVSLTGTTAVAGDTITLSWGNQTIAYVLTSSDITTGSAVVTVADPTIVAQGDGTFNVTASLTDQAGNSSLPSSPVSITVDTIAPSAPSIAAIPEALGGINAIEAANGTAVTVGLVGTGAIAGDKLTLTWGSQTVDYTLTANDLTTGSVQITVPASILSTQGNGTFNVTANLTDQTGNSSSNSNPVSVTVNTTAPAAPAISAISEAASGINSSEAADGTPVEVSLSGTGAVAGDNLTIDWGGQSVTYTLTSADISAGRTTVTVPSATIAAQGDGSFAVTAQLTDSAGNPSPSSAPVTVTVDTIAPSVPAISSIPEAASGINATEAADGTVVNVSLTGTGAISGDTLILTWGMQTVTYSVTPADINAGTAAVTVSAATIAAQGNGPFAVTARLVDQAGNNGSNSAAVPVAVDTGVPFAPSISSIPEATGGINSSEAANGTAVTVGLTGTGAVAGDSLRLNWGSQTIDYILTPSDISSGSTTIAVSASTIAAQGDGTVNVTAQLTDQAGNSSPTSAPVAVTIDTTTPAAPTILDLPEALGGLNRDESANGTPVNVSLAGTGAAAGDTLTLNWGTQPLSYVLTNSDITANRATVAIPAQLINAAGEGTIAVTAQLSDQAGNVGSQSAAVSAIVDLTLPTLANAVVNGNTLTLTYSEGLGNSPPAANAYRVNVNSSAASISAIAITNSAVTLTLANPVNAGDSVTVSYSQPGTNPIQDAAGNAASAFVNRTVTNSTVDTSAPTVDRLTPSAFTLSEASVSSGTFTLTAVYSEAMNPSIAPTFSFPTAGEDPGSTLSFGSGNWTNATTYVASFNVTDADTNLPQIDVRVVGAVDTAGNAQPATTFTDVFNIKTTNPTLTLSSTAPAIINAPFTVTAGFSEAVTGFTRSDITVSNGSITADPTSSDGGLTYRFTVSPTNNGTVSVSIGNAIAQDNAGNGNAAASNALLRTADLTAQLPTPPDLAADSDTGTSNADDLTADTTPTFTGTAEPNSTVQLFANSVLLSTVTTAADGTWSATPETPLTDGVYSITTTVTDALGNTSPASGAIAVTIDTTAPTGSLDASNSPSDDNPQGTLSLQFNEPVNTVDLADFTLTRDGTPVSLDGATLTTTDGMNWVIRNLAGRANDSGSYTLAFTPRNNIRDRAGNRLQGVISRSWSVEECHLGVATPNINFKGGKRGIRRRGTSARNRLNGTRRNDILNGLRGNDILRGRSGNDRLYGGLGRDDLRGDAGKDKLSGYRGNDRLNGGTNQDWVDGGSGNDRIVGGRGDDILLGGLGRDTLRGGQGRDMFVVKSVTQGVDRITDFNPATDLLDLRSIFTRSGFRGEDKHKLYHQLIQCVQVGRNTEIRIDRDGTGSGTAQSTLVILNNVRADAIDCSNFVLSDKACQLGTPTPTIRFNVGKRGIQFKGKSINHRVRGTQNNDRLQGNSGNDALQGRAGRDRLYGNRGNDNLNGGSDRDLLNGGANQDRLVGGSGDDVLIGGSGRDVLTGGRGKDMFVFQRLTQEGDRITDFKREDLLDLRPIFARREFAGARSHAIHSHLLQTVQRGSNTEIQIDADGNGSGKTFITVVTLTKVAAQTISCSNFVL